MAHFAELNDNNIVLRVLVIDNSVEHDGENWCNNVFGGRWIQTSYNAKIRKNYAGIGFSYNSELDAFIPPKPFNSWILNEETCQWQSPVPVPNDGNFYKWNEEESNWVLK